MKAIGIVLSGAVVASVLCAGAAFAAPSQEQKCEAAKNQEAGKYTLCLHKAEASLLKTRGDCALAPETSCYSDSDCGGADTCTKDLTRYGRMVARCESTFEKRWDRYEERAVDRGGQCPDGLLQTDVKSTIDDCVTNVAGGLAGDGLTDSGGDLAICSDDLDTCTTDLGTTQSDLGTCTTDLGTAQSDLGTCTSDLGTATTSLTTCTGDLGTCSSDLGACTADLAQAGSDLAAAQSSLTTCTTDLGTAQTDLTTCEGDLTTCQGDLAGAQACGNGSIDAGEDCDQGNMNGGTCAAEGFAGGTLACAAGCVFDTGGRFNARFVDNADGTITDNVTGLQWEKKVELGGGLNLANLHDADNNTQFAGNCSVNTSKKCQPDAASSASCFAGIENGPTGCDECTGGDGVCNVGSPGVTVWQWLNALNAASLGGHSDWRIPRIYELQSIVNYQSTTFPAVDVALHGASCGATCTDVTDPACSCNRTDYYWSSTAGAGPYGIGYVWSIDFFEGYVSTSGTFSGHSFTRAVRGGS